MKFEALFKPLQVGPYKLAHRVAMAPLTRMRAERESFAPRPLNAEYYGQRATQGGLIVAEASPVLSHGRGNPATPGIYSEAQVAGWRNVTDAVHAKGGIIFLQLWHVGRVSHSSFHGGELPVSASAIPIKAEGMKAMTADGKIADYETPRALETEEVKDIVEAFRQGAKTRSPRASTASKSTVPTAICSSSSCSRAATSAPINMAAESRTARAFCSRSRRPRSTSGGEPRRRPVVAARHRQ